METIPFWNNIYKTISSYCQNANSNVISELIKTAETDLAAGLLFYKPYTPESFDKWKKEVQINDNRNFEMLIHKIGKTLNLDCMISYGLFCNYLMFEYYGKVDDIETIVKTELYINVLLEKILHFYKCERMFLLKTIRFIIKHGFDEKDCNYKCYNQFITKFTTEKLVDNLIQQFDFLLHEITPKSITNALASRELIDRNCIEQKEVLLSLMVLIEHCDIDEKITLRLIKLFNESGFGLKMPEYSEYFLVIDEKQSKRIKYLQYAVLIVGLKAYYCGERSKDLNPTAINNAINQIPNVVEDHGLLLVLLSLLNYRSNKEGAMKYLQQSFNDDNFKQLYLLVNEEAFKDDYIGNIIKSAVWIVLNEICVVVPNILFMFETKHFVYVFIDCLALEDLAVKSLEGNQPCTKLVGCILNMFPYDFRSFSMLCSAMIQHDKIRTKIINIFKNLDSFTEMCSDMQMDSVCLERDYFPLPNIKIPVRTKCKIIHLPSNDTLMQFKSNFKYSFLQIMHAYVMTLTDHYDARLPVSNEIGKYMDNVKHGLKFLSESMQYQPELAEEILFVNIVQCIKQLQAKLSEDKFTFMDPIIVECLRLSTKIITQEKFNLIQELQYAFYLPMIPPNLYSIQQLFQLDFPTQSNLIQCIMKHKHAGNYDLLNGYYDLLHYYLTNDLDLERVTMPGIVFLFRIVFPQHLNWKFNSATDKNALSLKLINFVFDVLQMLKQKEVQIGKKENNALVLTHGFCMNAIYQHEPFIKTFLSLLRFTNTVVERRMCSETYWERNECDLLLIVRKCLTIVLWIFNSIEYSELKKTKFWSFFMYSAVNFPNVIKILCDYMNQKFDRVIPKLACKILKKMCLDPLLPVLASLEMDNYQVQTMFLERLRDPLEDNDMKANLLELINACVQNQNGMTAAFFNLSLRSRKKVESDVQTEETILGFMEEYLKNIKISQDYLKCPLQAAILDIFHNLWTHKRTRLVKDLIVKEDFWPILLHPLDGSYTLSCHTYSQILDILTLEVVNVKLDDGLQKHLTAIFNENSQLIANFVQFIELQLEAEEPGALELLYAWKKFVVFMVKMHSKLIHQECKYSLTKTALVGICLHLAKPEDYKIINHWVYLYLYLIESLEEHAYEGDSFFESIVDCFDELKNIYHILPRRIRESFIAVALKTLSHFDYIIKTSTMHSIVFLHAMNAIAQKEYEVVLGHKRNNQHILIDHLPWMLIVLFAKKLLSFEEHYEWYGLSRFPSKLFDLIGYYMSSSKTMSIAKLCNEFMKQYSLVEISSSLLFLPWNEFYTTIRIPGDLINFTPEVENLDEYREFWAAFYNLVAINLNLVRMRGSAANAIVIDMVATLRTEIFASIKLLNVTADLLALQLVTNCLSLCNTIIPLQKYWKKIDTGLLREYFETVSSCLNQCVILALRPKLFKFYEIDENKKLKLVNKMPVEYLATIMDRIMDVITTTAIGMIRISPKMVDLLAENNVDYAFMHVECDFHIPSSGQQINELPSNKVTFGSILCLVHYLCKIILQIIHNKNDKNHPKSAQPSTPEATASTSSPSTVIPKPKTQQNYVVFISPDYIGTYSVQDKFNSIQRFANSEIYSLTAPWLALMDHQRVSFALETLNTLLASQTFKSIKETQNNPMQLQLLKRDLCSELQFFHEFVRKKIVDPHKYIINGNIIIKNMNIETKHEYTDDSEYLLMLSHWFMTICQLTS